MIRRLYLRFCLWRAAHWKSECELFSKACSVALCRGDSVAFDQFSEAWQASKQAEDVWSARARRTQEGAERS